LFQGAILDHADAAEGDDAAMRDRHVTFEAAVIEHFAHFVDFEAYPRLVIDIGPQVAAGRRVVHENLAVQPDIEQRHAIRRPILAYRGEPATISRGQHVAGTFVGHQLVGTSYLGWRTAHDLLLRRCHPATIAAAGRFY